MFIRLFNIETGEDIYSDGKDIYIEKNGIKVTPTDEEADLICEMWNLLHNKR